MFKKWLPRTTSFFDFFEKHARVVVQGTNELVILLNENPDQIPARTQQIKKYESEADTITHQCVEELHKTFITPFEREDIYRLIVHMDNIIDHVEAAAELILLYKLKEIMPEAKELAKVLFTATQELEKAIIGLRTQDSIKVMKERFILINHLENEGDIIVRNAVGRLFDEVQDTRTLIKWKEVYENLENGIDCCEDVSNIIEGVILERD